MVSCPATLSKTFLIIWLYTGPAKKNDVCSFLQMVVVRHKPGLLSDSKIEKYCCFNSSKVYHSQKFCLISVCNSVYKNFFSFALLIKIKKWKTWLFKACRNQAFLHFSYNTLIHRNQKKNYPCLRVLWGRIHAKFQRNISPLWVRFPRSFQFFLKSPVFAKHRQELYKIFICLTSLIG